MTLFFFLVQVVTGALLLLYYRPSASEAYESVGFIMTRVPFGWLVRSIHAWSANLMIGAAFAHLFSVDLRARLPPAARAHMAVTGVLDLLHHVRVRLQRVPAAVERARVFRDARGHRHGGRGPGYRRPHRVLHAGRQGRERRDADAVLRCARRDSSGHHDGAARTAPACSCNTTA